jgi:NAD(P)H-flavin reductase
MYWFAEVLAHERRAAEIAVLTCRPYRPLPFRAGQRVPIECPYVPQRPRPYSIANAPRADGTLEFHVRAAGPVSSALVGRVKPGDVLRLGRPEGDLRIDPCSRRDLVFVAGGIGLAPAKALIDELIRYNRTRWIHLLRGARRRAGHYDRPNLDRLADRHPWLTIVRATSDEPDEHGRQCSIADLVTRLGPWRHHDFVVCGSAPMVGATMRVLDGFGVPRDRIQIDERP